MRISWSEALPKYKKTANALFLYLKSFSHSIILKIEKLLKLLKNLFLTSTY